ncbi:MAG TPA: ATP-binding cassette domain-containing protein [Steroidobacteraceae bacterium]|nr:ATP-binding cassette domain-containing protein [Steroidobacteraceae bacterium]
MNSRSRRGERYLAVELAQIQLLRSGKRVLHDLRWRIRPGQRWILRGDNGAGKTQLLKLIAGDVWPQPRAGTRRHYRWRRQLYTEPLGVKEEIAYVGAERQDRYEHYDWNLRVTEIVGTGIERSDVPLRRLTAAERSRVARLLRRVGIEPLARRRFLTLSQGERRLVLLARALAWRPALLLLDEPLNGLDPQYRGRMLAAIGSLRRSALPWVYVTHRGDEMPAGVTHQAQLQRGQLRTGRWRRTPPRRRPVAAAPKSPLPKGVRASRGRSLVALRGASVWRNGVPVLRRLTLQLCAGDCWVVHGAIGSGKSTLLAALHGNHGVAAGGTIWRRGQGSGAALSAFQRRTGFVAPELQAALPRQLSALEAVVAGGRGAFGLDGPVRSAERRAALRSLRGVGALTLASRRLSELSYGQARRVLFARALVRRPDILLFDEPYAGLDALNRARLGAFLDGIARGNHAIVIACHHRDEWPRRATHELELRRGAARYCGPLRR